MRWFTGWCVDTPNVPVTPAKKCKTWQNILLYLTVLFVISGMICKKRHMWKTDICTWENIRIANLIFMNSQVGYGAELHSGFGIFDICGSEPITWFNTDWKYGFSFTSHTTAGNDYIVADWCESTYHITLYIGTGKYGIVICFFQWYVSYW